MIKEIDFEVVNEFFYYDETSPSCLRWKVDRCSGKGVGRKHITVGDVAGTLDNGCYRVVINRKSYLVHRVIYCLHYGDISNDLYVDHKDGDRVNNKLSNLRLVTYRINTQNSKHRKNNTSGIKGVCRHTDKYGKSRWMAQWQDSDGRHRCRSFSVDKYGEEEAKFLATSERQKQIDRLNKEGQDYTDRHNGFIQTGG